MADDPAAAPLRRAALPMLFLFALAVVLRAIHLGRADLWGDEILFIQLTSPPLTPWQVWQGLWEQIASIGHMPFAASLHNALTWPWAWMMGDVSRVAWVQRLPGILMGAAAVPVVYRIGLRVGGASVGWTAGLFMAAHLFPVYFSREAYFYAPLMLFASLASWVFLGIVSAGRLSRRSGWALCLLVAATTLTHTNGILVGAGCAILALGCVALRRFPGPAQGRDARSLWLSLLGLSALGISAGLPFFIKKVMSSHKMGFLPTPPVLDALQDFLGKTLVGMNLPWAAFGWVVVVAGLAALTRSGPSRGVRVTALFLFALPFLAIFIASLKTLYYPRYFSSVIGMYYVVAAAGCVWLGHLLASRLPGPLARVLRHVPSVALLAPSLVLFLPNVYALRAKGTDYGGMARWLTSNLPAGTPFVMESAYDLRFVSGYFPTEGLVPAAPYVHGAGPVEMQRLRERQREFLLRFPEAAFVESARHGTEPKAVLPRWDWPARHFTRMYLLRNEPMARLAGWGVWPQAGSDWLAVTQYETPIYWTPEEDRLAAARTNGSVLFLRYPGWDVRQVQQGLYMRVREGASASVVAANLLDRKVRGRLRIEGAVLAPPGQVDVEVKWTGFSAGTNREFAGQMWFLETGELIAPEGEFPIEFIVSGSSQPIQGVLLNRLEFVPDAATASPPAP